MDISEQKKGKVDVGVLQETKLIDKVYTRESRGFWVTVTEAPRAHHGGVAVFYHEAEHFSIEELCLNGLDVIIF